MTPDESQVHNSTTHQEAEMADLNQGLLPHFCVPVLEISVEEHPNADRLEIARIGRFLSVVEKGKFQTGDLIAYIPDQAIVPESILEELNLTGKLAGPDFNRVHAVKLRGVLSQGICYPARPEWKEGQDVREELGIEKFVPEIPKELAGAVYAAGRDRCIHYDVENFKAYPGVLVEGEAVVITEKIHGVMCQMGLMPEGAADSEHGPLVVASKGTAEQGLAFQPKASENEENVYVRAAKELDIEPRIAEAFAKELGEGAPVFVLGEIYGRKVQDLKYGTEQGNPDEIGFRVFDVYIGSRGMGRYLNDDELDRACAAMKLERVPVLYRGPFSEEKMLELTDGKEEVSGKALHIREGVVVRTQEERNDDSLGRVQLKSVSEKYLLRKGGTEYS